MKPTAEAVISAYIKAAERGVPLKNEDGTPKLGNDGKPRVVYSCHTVYFKPVIGDQKMKSLNDTLRELGYDPIDESQKLIREGKIYGKPVKGGFSLSFVKTVEHKVKESTKKNMTLLAELLDL